MGFIVMLWVCPNISPDSDVYRELRNTDMIVHDEKGEIAIRNWWDGYSAILDMTNPNAQEWFSDKLNKLMYEYGIDGFKFDAGDNYFYNDDDKIFKPSFRNDHTKAFCEFAMRYKFNELRCGWNMGGKPVVMRLSDKLHSWNNNGLNTLIPNSLVQGILGYAYNCPDMIGGGDYVNFGLNSDKLDQELIVRYAQCSALLPMMQFSVAPWRVLQEDKFDMVKKATLLHTKFGTKILEIAENSSKTGEPITRLMEYEFPNEGLEYMDEPSTKRSDEQNECSGSRNNN